MISGVARKNNNRNDLTAHRGGDERAEGKWGKMRQEKREREQE